MAEMLVRRRIENRIFCELWKLLCLHVQRSGRGVAMRLNMEPDHLLAIGCLCALYVSSTSLHTSCSKDMTDLSDD